MGQTHADAQEAEQRDVMVSHNTMNIDGRIVHLGSPIEQGITNNAIFYIGSPNEQVMTNNAMVTRFLEERLAQSEHLVQNADELFQRRVKEYDGHLINAHKENQSLVVDLRRAESMMKSAQEEWSPRAAAIECASLRAGEQRAENAYRSQFESRLQVTRSEFESAEAQLRESHASLAANWERLQ